MDNKYDSLKKEYSDIYEYVTTEYSEEPAVLMDRITRLCIYLARTSKMNADAQYLLMLKTELVLKDPKLTEYSPSIQKSYIASSCKKEQHLVTCIERLNASITHQLDALRSQLSFIKTELTLNN